MARNHIGVFQKDTSDRVDNEIDQHVKVPLRDIDANRQWSQQNADTHSIAGRTISAHRAISRSTRPLAGAWKRPGARGDDLSRRPANFFRQHHVDTLTRLPVPAQHGGQSNRAEQEGKPQRPH